MKNTFIGSPIERREDLRFLRGRGEYVDDLAPRGLLYAVILRSSVAHGRICRDRRRGGAGDAGRACRHHRGGHAGRPAEDRRCGLQPLPEFKPFEQPVIADDKVRYVGEPIAVVLADSVGDRRGRARSDRRRRSSRCRPSPIARPPREATALLFENAGTNRAMTFTAAWATPTRLSRGAPMSGARSSPPSATTV